MLTLLPLPKFLPLACNLYSIKRRNLVVVRLAPGSVFEQWFRPTAERTWDLMLSYYTLPATPVANAEYVTIGGLSKFSALKDVYVDHPEIFAHYEYIMALDDDLHFEYLDIDRLFSTVRDYRLTLAQASLTPESFASYPVTKQTPGSRLRFTNFVEVMMPIFSKDAFRSCVDTFNKAISSWGLDQLWSYLLCRTEYSFAIIDIVAASHLRPIDIQNGAFYKHLARLGIEPHAEMQAVWEIYGFRPTAPTVYSSVAI